MDIIIMNSITVFIVMLMTVIVITTIVESILSFCCRCCSCCWVENEYDRYVIIVSAKKFVVGISL